LQKNHAGMWIKGAWTWLKAKASSGRTNNASKGVDERVWRCNPWSTRAQRSQGEDECAARNRSQGGHEAT
jgi:hypothetical protein